MHAYTRVRTSVALDAKTRDKLVELRRRWDLPSVQAVIEQLLAGPPSTARALYDGRKAAVDLVLSKHGVRRLVAFGSRARGEGRPDSDLDLAVTLPRTADLFDMVHLKEDLEEAFGIPVDIVSLASAPPRLKERIAREGVTLVG